MRRRLSFAFAFVVLIGIVMPLSPAAAQRSDLDAIDNRRRELYAAGNYAAALVEALRYEQAVRARFGTDNETYGVALNALGLVLQAQGNYAEAEGLFQQAVAIWERTLGANHPNVAAGLDNLANTYENQGKYAEAEALYRRALPIRERALGANHPEVAKTLNNLALVYEKQGKYADAEALYRRALAINERALGASHPAVAIGLNNLAIVYKDQGRYAEAEALYRRALAIRERTLGANHPDVAQTLNNLAIVYRDQGKYGEAEALYRRALTILEKVLGATHPDVANAVNNLAMVYVDQGKYADAETLYQRSLAIRERALGANHPDVAQSLQNLAGVYEKQGKYTDAEGLYGRALEIDEQALGANHPDVAAALDSLAVVYADQSKYAEAEGLYRRALTIYERALGASHPRVASALNNLANAYKDLGRYREAEELYRRAMAIWEEAFGAGHPLVAAALGNLGLLYKEQGRFSEAEDFYQRALAVKEKALGADHPDVGTTLDDLGGLYTDQGKYSQAEEVYQRAMAIWEKAFGASNRNIGSVLNNLGAVYGAQEKWSEAEGLFRRALAIQEQALGANHPDVADTLVNLALLYKDYGHYTEAEALDRRALGIYEQAQGADHPNVAWSLHNLADVYSEQGNYDEAEALYGRALAIREQALGENHPDVARTIYNLANVYEQKGQHGDAERFYQRALAIWEKAFGPSHPDVAASLEALAQLYTATGNSESALAYSRKATAAVIAHAALERSGARSGGLVGQRAYFFRHHVARLAAAAEKGIEPAARLGHEGLEVAQWAGQSTAASALQQMAARFASGSGALAALVREHQDLGAHWRDLSKTLVGSLSKPERQQDAAIIGRLRGEIADTEKRIAAVAARLEKEFPNYAALANPKPLQVDETQKLLNADEALVLFLDLPAFKPSPEQTFIWVVTKTDMRWLHIDLGTSALTERVRKLRAGLDRGAVAARAAVPIGEAPPEARGFLPFDLAVAHELYAALFGQFEDLIKDKQLLIVPSGPLTSLPFHVLVTQQPSEAVPDAVEGYADAAWLAKQNAITVLPSVASLAALRQNARGERAPKPYLGFGNPLLLGASGTNRSAWSVETCASTNKRVEVAALEAAEQPQEQRGVSEFFRGNTANVVAVRSLAPLPETAEELCEVGHQLGAGDKDILLGPAATVTAVEAMSDDGRLAHARVVHFATHGLIAGELKGLAEPALVLTPPAGDTAAPALEQDDGLLKASEVAELKLNADWVVLSACNTAAGEGNAEALSGLARAFFYAGARALLVSHWPVNSSAAVKLTTRAFSALEQPGVGRAEALRQAMLTTIAEGGPQAHPSYWAPFVVVGEGARL